MSSEDKVFSQGHRVFSLCMHGSRKFCKRGSKFDGHSFFLDEVREDRNTTISGQSTAHSKGGGGGPDPLSSSSGSAHVVCASSECSGRYYASESLLVLYMLL